MRLRVGSLFSGIGGFDKGLEDAGCDIAWQVESDPFARKILKRRWPHVTCGTDVREWPSDRNEYTDIRNATLAHATGKQQLERIDLLCGGFPCQDLSVAGKRSGLAGARSGLFHEFIRIAKALSPTWGLVENVPGLFSSLGGRDMATVLEGLRQCWPVVGYRVLDSRYWGVAQRRRRIFFVGGPSVERVEQVLFESESRSGDFTASLETGTDVAASLRSCSHRPGVNPPGRGGEDDMNLICAPAILSSGPPDSWRDDEASLVIAATPTGHHPRNNPTDSMIVHPLPARYNSSEDGGGRGTPLIPISEVGAKTQMGSGRNGCGIGQEGDPMFTLQAGKQHGVGVRRLTPTECEVLQGFPQGWTCLCQPIKTYDSNVCKCPDGPRYKTLGNAVTVPVIRWIGHNLMRLA